ncbi:MAG: tetraacyldisaccharide 4'-kinase [Pseudomonadota bacterium]
MKTPDYLWKAWHPLALLLSPLSLLFLAVTRLRRAAYSLHLKKVYRAPVPVIIVGNISVGGTGKTPLVIWLCRYLLRQGYKPGVVLRGYGGDASHWPQQVRSDSDPAIVGDEAVVIAAESGCPVCADPDRTEAVQELLRCSPCDVIISDDGLQHYALARDIEIAVIDGERRFGNGLLLPAGPLREPVSRLRKVDLVIINQHCSEGFHCLHLAPDQLVNLATGEKRSIDAISGSRVHAVSGIGNPARFYRLLTDAGIEIKEHSYPDHHRFAAADILFDDELPVIMTAKDAVKCRPYATSRHWSLLLKVQPSTEFVLQFTSLLKLRNRP